MTRSVATVLVWTLVLGACSNKPPLDRREIKSAPPPDPLTQAVKTVIKSCTLAQRGELRDCKGNVQEALKQAEERRGLLASLAHHCSLMDDKSDKVRAVAATRIGALSLHRLLKEQGTPELLECLIKVLERSWAEPEQWQAERVARAATFLATALDKHEELLKVLDKSPAGAKRVGVECLWTNGRMKVFDRLSGAAKDPDPAMRRSVVQGFAYVDHLVGDEQDRVCGLLQERLMDESTEVSGPAASQLARLCSGRWDAVLDAAARRLKKRAVGMPTVNALGHILDSTRPAPTAAQHKRATQLLVRIVRTPEKPCTGCAKRTGPSPARLVALKRLEQLEPRTAARLARRLKLDKKKPQK